MKSWALFALLPCLGCQGLVGQLLVDPANSGVAPPRGDPPPPEDLPPSPADPPPDVPPLPSVAVCASMTSGRGYRGLAGEALEADRIDAEALVDVDRPYRVVMFNYETWNLVPDVQKCSGGGVYGSSFDDPERKSAGLAASFGVTPDHWYAESEVGAFAVFTTFEYAFSVCQRLIATPPRASTAGWYEHTAFEPTPERARAYCQRAEHAAWLREPTSDEVQTCVDLALSLTDEPDVPTRWTYVCSSILSSSNFLSY